LCFILVLSGRALAQAVSRRPATAEARVQSQASLCGVCVAQSETEPGFSPSTLVYTCQYHSASAALAII